MSEQKTAGKKEVRSAYELALERLERDGIERPRREDFTDQLRARMSDLRTRAEAKLAELEILHRKNLLGVTDPAAREQREQAYRAERGRIEERRDRELESLRLKARSQP